MKIAIRNVLNEDFPFIFKLASETVKYQISDLRENIDIEAVRKNYLRDLEVVQKNMSVRPNSYFLIAEAETGDPLGYLLMATDVSDGTTGVDQGWIFDMAICEDYWKSEVPDKLLEEAEAIARRKNLKHIALQLTCSNKRALDFFKSRGYEEERKRMFKKIPLEKSNRKEREELFEVFQGIKFKINFSE